LNTPMIMFERSDVFLISHLRLDKMRDEFFYHTRIEYKVLVERKESMRIEITKCRNDAFKQMCLSYPGKVWAPLELNIPSRWIREDGFDE